VTTSERLKVALRALDEIAEWGDSDPTPPAILAREALHEIRKDRHKFVRMGAGRRMGGGQEGS
jgi:hypothetical protein